MSGVKAAFLFGSAATRDQHADSDGDVFVVEAPTVDRRGLLRHLAEVGMLIGREVNTVRYSMQQLAERPKRSAGCVGVRCTIRPSQMRRIAHTSHRNGCAALSPPSDRAPLALERMRRTLPAIRAALVRAEPTLRDSLDPYP